MASGSGKLAPRRGDVIAAVQRVRAALGERGVLMYHDARLPSFTAVAAGEVIRGSGWAHPKNVLIYAVNELADDIAWRAWRRAHGVSMRGLPTAPEAYATLEAAVAAWPGARLPWN